MRVFSVYLSYVSSQRKLGSYRSMLYEIPAFAGMTSLFKVSSLFILICVVLFLTACGPIVRGGIDLAQDIKNSKIFHLGRHGDLTEEEQRWAETAWIYFANNMNEMTGFAGYQDGKNTTDMWSVGDTLAALFSAHQLDIIEDREFDERLTSLLDTLNTMPLFDKKLPNTYYNIENASMTDESGESYAIGWDAVHIGRLLIWLEIIDAHYPVYSEYIQKAILRWNFCQIITNCGLLQSAKIYGDEIEITQAGRVGMEEYVALGYKILGFDTARAELLEPYEVKVINGVPIPYDGRNVRDSGLQVAVETLPYTLYGMEFNWDIARKAGVWYGVDSLHSNRQIAEISQNIYQVQKNRFEQERIITARNHYALNIPPYKMMNSIYADGFAWNTLGADSVFYPESALVSTSAVFGMWSLWRDSYTHFMMNAVKHLYDPARGWYEGRYEETAAYEKAITATTNAVVLSALAHKKIGKFFDLKGRATYSDILLNDMFSRPGQCFPADRRVCSLEKSAGMSPAQDFIENQKELKK